MTDGTLEIIYMQHMCGMTQSMQHNNLQCILTQCYLIMGIGYNLK